MPTGIQIVDSNDLFSVIIFGIVAIWVGAHLIRKFAPLRKASLHIAEIAGIVLAIRYLANVGPPRPTDFATAALVGLLGGFVALGPLWILFSIIGYLRGVCRSAIGRWNSAKRRAKLRREFRLKIAKRRQEQIDWEMQAPARIDSARAADQRNQDRLQQKREMRTLREKCLATCTLLYERYAPEIESRLSRITVETWIEKYMGDDQSTVNVEMRAEQLRQLIVHHGEKVNPTQTLTALSEIVEWYQDQRQQIESLPIDDKLRRLMIATLNVRNANLTEQLIAKMDASR